MDRLFVTLGLAAIVFAATDVDDFLLLIGLFADTTVRPWHVVVGQFVGIAILYAVSVVASFLAVLIPWEGVRFLGLIPIVIGTSKLFGSIDPGAETWAAHPSGASRSIAGVAVLTLANGGDNVAAYTSLFATRSGFEIALIGAVFAAMAALCCAAAAWLVRHQVLGSPIRRYGRAALPYLLIGLGLLILWRSNTRA